MAVVGLLAAQGVVAGDTVVLHDSNKLTLRVLPLDLVARVAHTGREVASLEVEVARRLVGAGAPVAPLPAEVDAGPHLVDGFTVTFWTHLTETPQRAAPREVARAIGELHRELRTIEVTTPHMLDRVAEAEAIVADPLVSPELVERDRQLLAETFADGRRRLAAIGGAEQLLHGEPHPGNVMHTPDGPRFIDLETLCRGPIEFDLAHLAADVAAEVAGVHPELLGECRRLVLAMVAAWRWDRDDEFPDRLAHGRRLTELVRAGPPWPAFGEFDD